MAGASRTYGWIGSRNGSLDAFKALKADASVQSIFARRLGTRQRLSAIGGGSIARISGADRPIGVRLNSWRRIRISIRYHAALLPPSGSRLEDPLSLNRYDRREVSNGHNPASRRPLNGLRLTQQRQRTDRFRCAVVLAILEGMEAGAIACLTTFLEFKKAKVACAPSRLARLDKPH